VIVGAIGRPANDGDTRVWYALLDAAPPDAASRLPALDACLIPVAYHQERLADEMRAEGRARGRFYRESGAKPPFFSDGDEAPRRRQASACATGATTDGVSSPACRRLQSFQERLATTTEPHRLRGRQVADGRWWWHRWRAARPPAWAARHAPRASSEQQAALPGRKARERPACHDVPSPVVP
jgi:hypothetical protein